MADTNNPMTAPASAPAVSKSTLSIAGLQVDVYGLAELPAAATSVTCLWLHHPRLRRKEDMAYVADEMVSAFSTSASAGASRGLIAVAFDQRNHGSRLASRTANDAWRQGNPTHAQDMFGIVSGTVADTVHLLDVLEGYLFGAGGGPGASPAGATRRIDSNLVLGVSLGGHSAWQLLFAEPRVTAGVIVIGCPDYMNMIQDRARLSKLQTFTVDKGASFMGSKDFPTALIEACRKYDPKAILFGTGDITTEPPALEQDKLRAILDAKIRGKRFQVLSGGADKLVPYNASRPFLEFFKNATSGWYKGGKIYVEDNVYSGVGHEFNTEMRHDAIRFVLDTVRSFDTPSQLSPKI
ncbi:putative N -aminopropylagmatine ureohydrolase [Rosellinia necatrix]|uniref:Putative N-aminopropylagmatine ureohydrolase n=1 Tax=Rosellinia necatrix TaxID=77044 RepID=A0A1S7UMM4_ROSNE|nr:putative N -aminopropylagmatine ureohydrolase [Rosellinia necatrix]